MTTGLWLAFVAASGVLLLIPGPTVLLVLSYALAADRLRRAIARPPVLAGLSRLGGVTLVGTGVATALVRRPA